MKLIDFIFDDKNWTVRNLVADTNRSLPGRKVLISPIVVEKADWEGKRLPVLLTQEQVKIVRTSAWMKNCRLRMKSNITITTDFPITGPAMDMGTGNAAARSSCREGSIDRLP